MVNRKTKDQSPTFAVIGAKVSKSAEQSAAFSDALEAIVAITSKANASSGAA